MEDNKNRNNCKKDKEEKENKKNTAAPKAKKKNTLPDHKLETVTGGGFPDVPRVPENDIDDETKEKF